MNLVECVKQAVNETDPEKVEKYRFFLKRLFNKYARRIQRNTNLTEKEKQKLLKKYADVHENISLTLIYKKMLLCDKINLYDLFNSSHDEDEQDED